MTGVQTCALPISDSVWIETAGRNLDRLCAAWDGDKMDSLMLLAPIAHSIGYDGHGDFAMDADGHLARRGDNRQVPFVFAGVSMAPRACSMARRPGASRSTRCGTGQSTRAGFTG